MDSNLNKTITLPKGRKIGMGSLKKDTKVTLIRSDKDTNGKTFYTGFWVDAKSGKPRYTCVSLEEAT